MSEITAASNKKHKSSGRKSSSERKCTKRGTSGQFMKPHRRFKGIPGGMPELLKKLAGEEVTLILNTGEDLEVKIEGVEGHLLMAKKDDEYIFFELPCICGVIADCEEILESLLRITDKKCSN